MIQQFFYRTFGNPISPELLHYSFFFRIMSVPAYVCCQIKFIIKGQSQKFCVNFWLTKNNLGRVHIFRDLRTPVHEEGRCFHCLFYPLR